MDLEDYVDVLRDGDIVSIVQELEDYADGFEAFTLPGLPMPMGNGDDRDAVFGWLGKVNFSLIEDEDGDPRFSLHTHDTVSEARECFHGKIQEVRKCIEAMSTVLDAIASGDRRRIVEAITAFMREQGGGQVEVVTATMDLDGNIRPGLPDGVDPVEFERATSGYVPGRPVASVAAGSDDDLPGFYL